MPLKFPEHAYQKLIPPQGVKPAWPGPSIHPLAVICRSGFANCSARSLPSDSGKFHQGSSFGDGLGKSLRLKLLVPNSANSQTQQAVRQAYSFQALVETESQSQARQTAGKNHSFQALIEITSECQSLQTAWKGCPF